MKILSLSLASTTLLILTGCQGHFANQNPVQAPVSKPSPQATVQNCSAMLPPGHRYDLTITGNIDKRVNPPTMNGTLSVTDPDNPTVSASFKQQLQPFMQCVRQLIRNR